MGKKVKEKIVNQPIELVWCGMVADSAAGVGLHVDERGENMDYLNRDGSGFWARAVYNTRGDARNRYQCVKRYLLVPNTPANRKRLGVASKKGSGK